MKSKPQAKTPPWSGFPAPCCSYSNKPRAQITNSNLDNPRSGCARGEETATAEIAGSSELIVGKRSNLSQPSD